LGEINDVVFKNLVDIIQPKLVQFNDAMNSTQNILLNNNVPTLTQLSRNEIISQIDLLVDLLNIQQAFGELINFILGQIFSLISTITDATEGLLVPLLSTVTGILQQMAGCEECLNRTIPTHTRHHISKIQTIN
jgi:hypothetical protein